MNKAKGFTLVEMMIAMAIMAILAAIALPAYQSYIIKNRARTASADLVALATDLTNTFQRTLAYPVLATTTNATTQAATIGWIPAQGGNFVYSVTSTASTYTLTATGTGNMNGCDMTLTETNVRTATNTCGFTAW